RQARDASASGRRIPGASIIGQQEPKRRLWTPAAGVLLNMLHRNFELVEGTIVAFVTGCGSAAEVVSRASTESSVNIAFIAAGEPTDRLRAYFDHYFEGVDHQVRTWKNQLSALSDAAAALHRKGIERRQNANNTLRSFVENSMSSATSRWPKTTEQRFKELGDPLGYRTVYARMSSEVHADAEETLRYLLGTLHSDQNILEAMALETVFTQRLYVHYALSWFLKASIIYATRYAMVDIAERLRKDLIEVENELRGITLHIGSGLEEEPELPDATRDGTTSRGQSR